MLNAPVCLYRRSGNFRSQKNFVSVAIYDNLTLRKFRVHNAQHWQPVAYTYEIYVIRKYPDLRYVSMNTCYGTYISVYCVYYFFVSLQAGLKPIKQGLDPV